jgi:RNA polymerase sigma-70 factor (ECF subfamily)
MNDETLIKLLNASDRDAFGQLYDKYVGMVHGFLRSLLKDNEQVEDITQWCFMQLWEHRHQMDSGRNLPAWLYVLARNSAYKELRRQVTAENYIEYALNFKERFALESSPATDVQVISEEVVKVIENLPDSRKKIFKMRTLDGMSVGEIAQTLGISPKTVETQIARAKSAIREHISELLFLAIAVMYGI